MRYGLFFYIAFEENLVYDETIKIGGIYCEKNWCHGHLSDAGVEFGGL